MNKKEQISFFKEKLGIHEKNLANLELQKAKYTSLNVPPHILTQIEEEKEEISRLEIEIKKIAGATNESEPLPQIPEAYKKWLIEHCSYMDIDRLREKAKPIQVSLPEIFIPLYTSPPVKEPKAKDKQSIEKPMREEERLIDIEELALRSDYLLIEGQPGSGKTTLLKHLVYTIVPKENDKGLNDYLPILIFLKYLKGFFDNAGGIKRGESTAEALLSYYFNSIENVLDLKTVNSFCRAKKVIFLLDGLDEIEQEYREVIVHAFADYRVKNEGNKVVLSGRPHGLEGPAINRFGKNHIKILPLNMNQVDMFIRKWFDNIYSKGSSIASKTAESMLSEIESHPATDMLKDNPLMLTAICMLYLDEKELPGQRAELYKKFIICLLYKRFNDPERVYDFLKTLAFKMHSMGVSGADRVFATQVLRLIYKIDEKETEVEYRERIEGLFDTLEPKSGLLKFESGQHSFWHLTFQEFLTAVYIIDNNTDYAQAIKDYWDEDRYKEVIELYIGYLSIENKKWANQIVSNIIKEESPSRWLLASRAMIDMPRDRRENDVLKKGRERLLTIINSEHSPRTLIDAGETLGWLGDPRDLKEFVQVSGGEYRLKELGKFPIKPFHMGKYPVTNNWFEEFIKEGGYNNPEYWSDEGKKWLAYTKAKEPRLWNERKWKCPNSPVVGVSWYEAYAFTRWLTLKRNDGPVCGQARYEYRLPDENEWQASAGGFEGREYPWGNKWEENRCNTSESKIERTSPVGIFQKGNTPEKIADLSGNVWEWTTLDYYSKEKLKDFKFDEDIQKLWDKDSYSEYLRRLKEKHRQLPVIRGGSWYFSQGGARCAYRYWFNPVNRLLSLGFRCVRTLK